MLQMPLASPDDVAAVLGRDLTEPEEARVGILLEKASALFRRYAGQQFTPGQSSVWLTVRDGNINLPQRPVTAVAAVASATGAPVGFTFNGSRLTVPVGWSGKQLLVTYRHGGDVPDLVRTTVADVVQKVLTIPDDAASGAQQKTVSTGPYSESYTYAQWALGGQASFSPNDEKIARSYRSTMIGSIHVR